jgi:hypothetical protein
MKHSEIGAAVYRRFNIKELDTRAIFLLLPNRFIDAGLQLSSFGFENYGLTQVQASFAKQLSTNFSVGTNLVYLNENSFLEPENRDFFAADAGIFYRTENSLSLGFTAENLLHTDSQFPTVCNAGVGYEIIKNCTVFFEGSYNFQKDFHVSAGIEYLIETQFAVRGGWRNNPKTPSLGAAYIGKQWKAETAFLLHPVLGLSSAVGIAYFF